MASQFSIITVTKNNLSGLVNTWQSVNNQTYKDWDWIIVDNMSEDGTSLWLEDIKRKGNSRNIIYVRETDHGIYDGMNKGIKYSKGKYLAFLNAGDFFTSNDVLYKLSTIIKNTSTDFIYGNSVEIDRNYTKIYKKAISHKLIWYGMFAHHQSMFFKRSIAKNISYKFKYPIGADYAYVIDYLNVVKTIQRVTFPICTYKRGGLSTTKDGIVNGNIDQRSIKKDLLKLNPIIISIISMIQTFLNNIRNNFPSIYYYFRRIKKLQ